MLTRHHLIWLLPIAGVLELLLHIWAAGRAPRFDDYKPLAKAVDDIRKPGDLIIMAPGWAEPPLRRALGDARMPLSDVARPDADGYPAAIEVSALGQRSAALAEWTELSRIEAGAFEIRRLQNPAHKPAAFDFVGAVAKGRAKVQLASTICPWNPKARLRTGGLAGHPTFPRARFECGGSPYYNVAATTIADQRWRPRRCIWAHPPDKGRPLTITFKSVPLGSEIVGHSGMYWVVERQRLGAPVTIDVSVATSAIGSHTHRDGDGWSRFVLPLGAHASSNADVTFTIRTPDNRHRHFCFEARSR